MGNREDRYNDPVNESMDDEKRHEARGAEAATEPDHVAGPCQIAGGPCHGQPTALYRAAASSSLRALCEDHAALMKYEPVGRALIAAAPDMLAALRELGDWSGKLFENAPGILSATDGATFIQLLGRVNVAIAKAEGRA